MRAALSWKWASTDCQQFLALHHGLSKCQVAVISYIHSRDRLYRLKHSVSLSYSFENEVKCGCLGGCRGNIACYLPIKSTNSPYIDVCDHSPIRLPTMQDQKLWTLCWLSFSEWGWECVTFSFAYKCSLYLNYENLHPIATQITQDARPIIIHLPLTVMFRMGQGAFLNCFWLQRQPIHQKRTTIYQCQYFVISNRISRWDHKSKNPWTGSGDWNLWV